MTAPLWSPSPERAQKSRMREFADLCAQKSGRAFATYREFHDWSLKDMETFWSLLWDYAEIIGDKGETILERGHLMPGARFFPSGRLSFAENLLRREDAGTGGADAAIIFRGEDGEQSALSWDDLRALVSRLQQAMRAAGVKKGDRIAAMAPNCPETIAFMLAANSLGAVWSSCSPDFGVKGVLDRFGQIEPVLFIVCDGYRYNGKPFYIEEKAREIARELGAAKVISISHLDREDSDSPDSFVSLAEFIAPFEAREIVFEKLPFNHPLYILFSSGTTGMPKSIVHGQGGTLLKHLSEHILHCDLHQKDRIFYFTTCGWMMWNWLVSALAVRATLLLYDGSPFHPDERAIFDYMEEAGATFFGVSAKFIDAVRKSGLRPIKTHNLESVRTIASTGSPLSPENFVFVYEGIKTDVHLASFSGGTDIAGCFVGCVPWNPVHAGEIQAPILGMASDVYNESGESVQGEKGELVCTRPFPSMPLGFWGDAGDRAYREAYFARFENVWCHGDFAQWTPQGGMIIHGRSDATLNPGGVRIGTAEIYNQAERMPEIEECVCIGQEWENDTRLVLFVRLSGENTLTAELEESIRQSIRQGASPRHVPAVIVQVDDIPRTRSGKIVELAVREIVHNRSVKNQEALANPEALDLFRNLPQLSR